MLLVKILALWLYLTDFQPCFSATVKKICGVSFITVTLLWKAETGFDKVVVILFLQILF